MKPHETSAPQRQTRPPLPIWSIPLMLVILGIVLFVGNLSMILSIIVGAEVVGLSAYLIVRGRTTSAEPKPVSNVLSLLPGHLLLLLAVSLLPSPDALAGLWAVIPAVSVAYDRVTCRARLGRGRTSTLIGLYAILWAVLFALLDRVIAIHRSIDLRGEVIVAAALGLFGVLFVSLGIYRHLRAGKE